MLAYSGLCFSLSSERVYAKLSQHEQASYKLGLVRPCTKHLHTEILQIRNIRIWKLCEQEAEGQVAAANLLILALPLSFSLFLQPRGTADPLHWWCSNSIPVWVNEPKCE